MAYQVTVTDVVSSIAWVVAHTSNRRVALRWAEHQRAKLAGTMADVGVWDTSTDRWVRGQDDNSFDGGH